MIDAVIFDIGNVLLKFDYLVAAHRLMKHNGLTELPDRAPIVAAKELLEGGRIDRAEFLRRVRPEFSHAGTDEEFVAMLRRHKVALVVADTAGLWPYREDITADFMYMRLHGDSELYRSGYDDDALARWASRIRAWANGGQPADASLISSAPPPKAAARDVYCYFDNDVKVHAPYDAQRLAAMLGVSWQPLAPGDARR